jgi:hypothetical protein
MKRINISSGFFGLALLCLLLPWYTVSCQQQQLNSATGIEVAVGSEKAAKIAKEQDKIQLDRINSKKSNTYEHSPVQMSVYVTTAVRVSLLLLLIGFAAGFIRANDNSLINLLARIAGRYIIPMISIAAAFITKVLIDEYLRDNTLNIITVTYGAGYWGYMLMISLAILSNAIMRDNVVIGRETSELRTSSDGNDEMECPMCAEKIKRKALLCKHCGSKLAVNAE